MTTITDELIDASVRVDALIWLPVADGGDAPCELLEEFVFWLPERDDPLYEALPMLKKYKDADEYPEVLDVAEELMDSKGFLMQVSTPVRTLWSRDTEEDTYTYSWGHTWSTWVFGLTPEDAGFVALAWANERIANDKAKAA